MAAVGTSDTATVAALRSVLNAATPTRQDFGAVVSELQSKQMVGKDSFLSARPTSP
jgi:hypothetical protein